MQTKGRTIKVDFWQLPIFSWPVKIRVRANPFPLAPRKSPIFPASDRFANLRTVLLKRTASPMRRIIGRGISGCSLTAEARDANREAGQASHGARQKVRERKTTPKELETSAEVLARVLVCDDEKLVRSCVREMLKDINSVEVVGEADNGHAAMRLALELQPDIVLMDVSMEHMDGIEATRRILAEAPRIRVLAFSSDSDARTARKMFAAGASGYLLKGGDKSELAFALHTVLAGRRFVSGGIGASERRPGRD